MVERVARGVELAVRTGAAPVLLGLRWLEQARREHPEVPLPRWSASLVSKVVLDELFFMTELVSGAVVSRHERARVARELGEALELYAAQGWLDDPSGYHPRPPPAEVSAMETVRSAWGRYVHVRFQSEYVPHPHDPAHQRWIGLGNNHTAHAWLLEHPGVRRPWLICIPGYRMGRPAVDFTGFRVRWLHRTLGLNVAIPVLPLHGPRRVGRRGGDGFFTGNFVDTVHAQTQALWDVRRLIGWLRAQHAPAVGVHGVSLGGYTAAMLACLEEDLECVIAGIPAADFLRLLRSHMPGFVVRSAEQAGVSLARIERLLRVVSPLALPPRVPHERRYLYAGVADRLASPDHARDLWHHWERPRLAWYEGGHVSFLWEGGVADLIAEALRASGMVPHLETG